VVESSPDLAGKRERGGDRKKKKGNNAMLLGKGSISSKGG